MIEIRKDKTYPLQIGRTAEEPKKRLKLIAPAGLLSPEDRVKLEKMGYDVVFPFEHRKRLEKVV